MKVTNLGIKNFRGLNETNINTDSEYVVFLGNNGEGKTSIIESIYYCFTGSSFRTKDTKYIVNNKKDNFEVKCTVNDDEKIYNIRAEFKNDKKQFFINDKLIKDRRDLIYNFPTIVFVSEDIDFITGTPSEKRKFFDQVISLCDEEYLLLIKKYKSIITERNKLLKIEDKSLFSINDEMLAELNEKIQVKRRKAVNSINEIIKKYYGIFFEKENRIEIEYKKNLDAEDKETILRILKDNTEGDIFAEVTRKGIHRDDFVIKKGIHNYVNYASKGQLRLLALLYRFAEVKYLYENNNRKPFILIDDVFLELDKARRKIFFENLDGFSQMFLTFLPDENYFELSQTKSLYYKISDGNIEKL